MGQLYQPKIVLDFYVGSKKYTIDGLHIEFDTTAQTTAVGYKAVPNTAKISVWNLAESTRRLFSEAHQGVELRAGYGSDIGLVFAGQTTNVLHERERVDWRTDIYAGDGVREYQTRFFLKAYSAGTPIVKQLKDMCAFSELPYAIDTYILESTETILSGETYAGKLNYCLDDICRDHKWEWSIYLGRIEVYQKDSPFRSDPVAVVMSPETGMLGAPIVIDRTEDEPLEQKKEKLTKAQRNEIKEHEPPKLRRFAVQMVSLLNHQIKPKRIVDLRAKTSNVQIGNLMSQGTDVGRLDVSGLYTARIVRHAGNNFGGAFETTVIADLHD